MARQLARLTWPDTPRGGTVLVPVGSTEQHGPHLPLETDTVIAAAVAAAAADELAGTGAGTAAQTAASAVVVAPALPYGASGEHQRFPGTVSLGFDALVLVLVELVRSLSTWADRTVFVNGHGGNVPSLSRAVGQLLGEGHAVGWVPCSFPGADAHAGRTETSLMLHLAPDTVRSARAVPGNTAPLAELLPLMKAHGVDAVSASGILGDPAGASAAEGQELLRCGVASVLARLAGSADRHGCLQPQPEPGPQPEPERVP